MWCPPAERGILSNIDFPLDFFYGDNMDERIITLIGSEALNKINVTFAKEAKERKCSILYDIDTYKLL